MASTYVSGPVSGTVAPPEQNGHAAPAGLPEGFVRLADIRPKSKGKDAYAALRDWVGKTIQLDFLTFQKNDKGEVASGTMKFSEYDPNRPEGVDAPTFECPIPGAAFKAIYRGVQERPDDTIVCTVVQHKRGVALQ